MANPTEKQTDYMLQLANKLTGERVRYASQSSIDLKVKTSAEASAYIDQLQDAIEAHEKWLEETGLTIGAKIRRHYTRKDGEQIIIAGEVIGYTWSADFAVYEIRVEVDAETLAAYFEGSTKATRRLVAAQFGDEALADPAAELEAERAKLLARLAEIDGQLAALRS
jgi:hypothetical protein